MGITVSLEKGIELKKVGWFIQTYFAQVGDKVLTIDDVGNWNGWDVVMLPTASEIADLLPYKLLGGYEMAVFKTREGLYYVGYGSDISLEGFCFTRGSSFKKESLAEALADLWLWCVSNKYIKVEG